MDLDEEIPADPYQQQAVTGTSNILFEKSADASFWPQKFTDHCYRIKYYFENKVHVVKAAIEDE